MNADRTLPHDWFPGKVPGNVHVHETAYLETSYSFQLFRSTRPDAVHVGEGSSIYLGVMFDLGTNGAVNIGSFALLNGARIISDYQISIGDHCLISWNVVLMDSYRFSFDAKQRRKQLEQLVPGQGWECSGKSIAIGNNVWIGFDSCVLPGVNIGDGSVVGARSVVTENVPPMTVVAGNPARVIRSLK